MAKAQFLRSFIDVRADERRIAALMCGYFFLVITSFWILKPIKKTLFIGHYSASGLDLFGSHYAAADAELLAKVLNMFVAALAAIAFSILSNRLRREQLTYVFTGFFALFFCVFAVVLQAPGGWAVWSFYLFGDLFSTLMVATFFSFLNDSVSSGAAKRLYGIVGFGGVAGGVFGSSAVALWISSLSTSMWLVVTTMIAGIIVLVARAAGQAIPDMEKRKPSEAPKAIPPQAPTDLGTGSAFAGLRLVFGSSYLLSIVAVVGLYELVSTLVDYQFTRSMIEFSENDAARSQNFATFFAATNWLSMIVQLFLTSFIMRRFGLATALLVLPFTIALASIGFVFAPSLVLGGLLNMSDNGFSYSINQSAKEVLYVPTSAAEKYQAKAFIDMFVQRFAKALGVGLALLVAMYFDDIEGVRRLSLFILPILGVWALAALFAGRRFKELEDRDGSNA